MKILLDTHILIRSLVDSSLLSKDQFTAIERASSQKSIHISAITIWEIIQLEKRKRLFWDIPTENWVSNLDQQQNITVIPLHTDIAVASHNVPNNFPKDPADRFIAATAKIYNLTLLTNDKKIINSNYLNTIE